jgi:DNA-binding transcriptional LysR family regulator
MTDRQLRYILTVAEEKSITRASGKLNITQPSLSALVSNVEEELGLKLFNRDASMSLTYAGERYVEAARKTLDVQTELHNLIKDIKGEEEGRLSVGCSPQLSAQVLPAIIPVFYRKRPKSQIRLLEAPAAILENRLLSNDLDLAFTGAPVSNELLDHIRLYDEEVVLFTPKNYRPVFRRKKSGHAFPVCDFSDMSGRPFVLFEQGRYMRFISDMIFSDFDITPQVFFETNNWQTCYRMVEKGIAFTFLPYSVLPGYDLPGYEQIGELKKFSIPGNYERHISIYYKKRTYQTKLMRSFLEMAQETFAKLVQTAGLK